MGVEYSRMLGHLFEENDPDVYKGIPTNLKEVKSSAFYRTNASGEDKNVLEYLSRWLKRTYGKLRDFSSYLKKP